MKNIILFFLLTGTLAAQAQQKQSLKDLLYSGKLKKDSTGVIRSTDDLSSKIDTSTKKEVVVAPVSNPVVTNPVDKKTAGDDKKVSIPKDEKATIIAEPKDTSLIQPNAVDAPKDNAAPTKSNTRLWKEYTDSLTRTLKTDVLSSKQVKKGTYFLLADYELGTDGQVSITNVSSTPENAFLQAQVKQIMESTPLRLAPALDGAGQPKKVKRRQQFTVTKE